MQELRWLFPQSVLVALFGLLILNLPGQQGLHAQETALAETPQDSSASEEEELEVTPETIRKTIRDLEADDLATRDAAEDRIVKLGAAVLPFLPSVDANTSGELKIRLERIRQTLQTETLEEHFEATLISITGTMSVSDAINELSELSDNSMTLQGEDAFEGLEVDLDYEEEPFWSVLEDVMEQADLRLIAFGTTDNELVVGPGGQGEDAPQAYTTGPFRVGVSSVQSTLPFGVQIGGQLQVSLQVAWEPRLKPVFMQIPMSSLAVEVEDGELAAANPQAAPEIPLNYGGSTTQVDLLLERPDREVKELKKLTGEFVIAVPGQSHKYEFKKFGNGARQSQKFGDVAVILEGSRRNGSVYEMRVKVEFGNSQGALDSFRGFILSNKAYLLGENGGRLENVGLQTYAITNNSVGIAYLFQINGDPNDYTLVYESPSSVSKQTVEYELSDIPLP